MTCPHCGRRTGDGWQKCEYCGLDVKEVPAEGESAESTTSESKAPAVKSSVFFGTIGALIGSLLGGVLVIIASDVAGLFGSLVGMAVAALGLIGYRILGRRLTNGGVMISVAMILTTTYLADRLDWAYRVADWHNANAAAAGVPEIDVISAFMQLNTLIDSGTIDLKVYLINIGALYLFCAIGIFGTLRTIFKRQRANKKN